MHPDSPHYQFDPTSIGWLHRQDRRGDQIRSDDIMRLLKADSSNAADTVMQKYLLPALEGKLNGKRGRSANPPAKGLRFQAAARTYVELLAEFKRQRKAGERPRKPYEREPSIQMAEQVIEEFHLGLTPHAFFNQFSKLKTRNNAVNASPAKV